MSLMFYKYRLPFTEPLKTSKNVFSHRKGIILEYTDGINYFYGEAAPLPGFSTQSLDEVIKSLTKYKKELAAIFNQQNPVDLLADLYCNFQVAPSMQFGLDSIAYQVKAERGNKSLKDHLFTESPDVIPVNFLISMDNRNYLKEIYKYRSNGFNTLKVKVGIDFQREYKALKEIRSQFPDLKIRLDANQSWGLDRAVEYCNKFSQLNIQYIEEPLKNVTSGTIKSLREQINVPLAIDETIFQISDWKRLLPYSSFVILKPMVLGSFKTIFETKELAIAHDNEIVFTTSLESGIGRRITALLAAGLGTKKLAQGLSTGYLFTNDLLSDTAFISDGSYRVDKQLQKSKIDLIQLKPLL